MKKPKVYASKHTVEKFFAIEKMEDVLGKSISTTRIHNVVQRFGKGDGSNSLKEFIQMSYADLLKLEGCGAACADGIVKMLDHFGLELKGK